MKTIESFIKWVRSLYEVISNKNKGEWIKALEQFPKKDIFYLHEYCNLYPSLGDGEPYLFVYRDEEKNQVCYVFFKRNLQEIPFFRATEAIYDIITPPYGYGGPFYMTGDKKQLILNFRKEFEEYCQKENIISEFVRFHPLYQNHVYLEDTMDVFFDRETVYVDLEKREDQIVHNYHKNHRRNLNKAIKNQLHFHVFQKEDAVNQVEIFYELYKETMDKLNAASYSYFSTIYIENLLSDLTENAIIAAAFYQGHMVSAALCLMEGGSIHYHLGCSRREMLYVGINVFLLHQTAIWAKQQGCHTFHLGGGHVGRDSLFQFKYRFNSSGILPFYVGRKIHHQEKYQSLVDSWEEYYKQKASDTFFPAYRMKPIEFIGT